MEKPRAILLLLVTLAHLGVPGAEGAKPVVPKGPIAVIADRRVDEADIHRAALVMENDPTRTRRPGLWRKKLLDLCVDRELLALEAERTGFTSDPAVKHEVERSSAEFLYGVIRNKLLLPELTPTAADIDTAIAGGLFRRVKLEYILSVGDRQTTRQIFSALQKGARFDSVAALNSVHPSATKGAKLGWKFVGSLNAASWSDFKTAKPGDVLGPYPNSNAHEIYKIEAIEDLGPSEVRSTMLRGRTATLDRRYHAGLLQKYRFAINPENVSAVIFASATESADSILASLDAEGRRPKRGVRPSLGILARADGDSITYRDIAYPEFMARGPDGKAPIEETERLLALCSAAMLPRLIVRDARERGIDRDPAVVRRLSLIREEASTRAMVAHAVPAPDSAKVHAYFESHRERYRVSAARRALVAVFASEDTARSSLSGWKRGSFRDSVFAAGGFRSQSRATATSLLPRCYAEMPVYETDQDPLSLAVRSLAEGQVSSVVPVAYGRALALVLGREPARALSFEEVWVRLPAEMREEMENAWVVSLLERLRAATPARTVPARLEAVRLGVNSDTGGKRR